jgi:leader peptidase (prepilin peptidase)/N-methyltransferase
MESIPYGLQQFLVFVVGCCLGSFYNVVIHRLPRDESLVRPGSHCPQCGMAIRFYDNVPLLSYLWLRGRCRHCRDRIPVRYPVVEALAGLFALALFRRYGWHPQFPVEYLFVSLLLMIAFIDWDTFIIPDELSLSGAAAGVVFSLAAAVRVEWWMSLLGLALGAGFFCAVERLYWLVRRREGLGYGDVKLLGMVGAFLGVPGVVFTVLAGSFTGALVGLAAMARSGEGLQTRIPFGPFLSLGAGLYVFFGETLLRWYWG